MNAVSHGPVHPTHTYRLLLQREFWEHKGGFFWAPLVAGTIFLLLGLMGIGAAEIATRRALHDGHQIRVDGKIMINGLDLANITRKLGPEEMKHLADGVDLSLIMASSWPFIVLTFVVFFYCLSALYDDRRDRSVLFWKSLPVSDRDTVLSKAISATLVAPLLATGAAIATMFGFLLLMSLLVLFHGGNPWLLLWGPGSPLTLAAKLLVSIPVYAVWALPTVGWLLLCSAWARSKPFLWAIMIPVFAGIFVSWFDLMQLFNLEAGWFWKHVVARALLSTVPGSDIFYRGDTFTMANDGFENLEHLLSPSTTYAALLRPETWIGAVAGIAMLFAAIRLRRWRDEG